MTDERVQRTFTAVQQMIAECDFKDPEYPEDISESCGGNVDDAYNQGRDDGFDDGWNAALEKIKQAMEGQT